MSSEYNKFIHVYGIEQKPWFLKKKNWAHGCKSIHTHRQKHAYGGIYYSCLNRNAIPQKFDEQQYFEIKNFDI
jgi:hypothetical protein